MRRDYSEGQITRRTATAASAAARKRTLRPAVVLMNDRSSVSRRTPRNQKLIRVFLELPAVRESRINDGSSGKGRKYRCLPSRRITRLQMRARVSDCNAVPLFLTTAIITLRHTRPLARRIIRVSFFSFAPVAVERVSFTRIVKNAFAFT